jgi:methylase of polypeptide subunit release factors
MTINARIRERGSTAVAEKLKCSERVACPGKDTEETIDVVQQKWLGLLKDLSSSDIEEFLESISKASGAQS